MAAKKLSSYQKLLQENRELKTLNKELEKEIIDLDRIASFLQFDETAGEYADQIRSFVINVINIKKKAGATEGNRTKTTTAAERRKNIKEFIERDPDYDFHPYSREYFLIKTLKLEVTERTVSNDLKKINLEKR